MTLRRVYSTDDGGQLLVTVFDDNSIEVATRLQTWDTWSPPLPFDYADDDKADE